MAEGTGREGKRESRQFFNIAKGSVYEVVSLLQVMKQRGFVGQDSFQKIYDECDEIARMLSGLMR
ncbi:MAG: four helix bundle protein [Candidatus Binatia bacterium]